MAVLSPIRALSALGALALAGCYSPELRDCAVTCTADTDCAPGQVCGRDSMCASPSLAGRCPRQGPEPAPDAAALDAAQPIGTDAASDASTAPVDAPVPAPMVQLRLKIDGRGRIDVVGTTLTCADTAPAHMCTFDVVAGVPLTVHAVPSEDSQFENWESATCAMQGETCTFTSAATLTVVEAKFKTDD